MYISIYPNFYLYKKSSAIIIVPLEILFNKYNLLSCRNYVTTFIKSIFLFRNRLVRNIHYVTEYTKNEKKEKLK